MTDDILDGLFIYNNTLILICTRKSQEPEDRQVTSNEDQKECCQLIAKGICGKELPESNIFSDSKTAKIAGFRPGFNRMKHIIEEAIRRNIKVILICWDCKRLARNGEEGGFLVDRVGRDEINIITDTQGSYDDKNFFMLFVYFGVGAQESKNVSDGVKRNNDYKTRRGIYSGKSPLGYKYDPNKFKGEKDHIPNLNFTRLREWIEMLLTGDFEVKQSLDIMTARGLQGNKGKPISLTNAYTFLHSIFNTGMFQVRSGRNKGIYQGTHKPLLSMSEYNQLQKLISKGKQSKQEALWFMGELFHCESCGSAITGYRRIKKYKNGKSGVWYYAKCTNKKGNCTEKGGIPLQDLNDYIKTNLKAMKFTPRFIEWLRKAVKKQNKTEIDQVTKDHELLTKKINNVRDELNKVFDKKAEGFYINRPELYEEEKNKILKQEQLLLGEMSGDKTKFYRGLMEDKVDFIEKMERLTQSNNPVIKRMLIKIIGSNLTIGNKKIIVEPKKSFIALQKLQNQVEKELSIIEPMHQLKGIVTKAQTDDIELNITTRYRVRESNP